MQNFRRRQMMLALVSRRMRPIENIVDPKAAVAALDLKVETHLFAIFDLLGQRSHVWVEVSIDQPQSFQQLRENAIKAAKIPFVLKQWLKLHSRGIKFQRYCATNSPELR